MSQEAHLVPATATAPASTCSNMTSELSTLPCVESAAASSLQLAGPVSRAW